VRVTVGAVVALAMGVGVDGTGVDTSKPGVRVDPIDGIGETGCVC